MLAKRTIPCLDITGGSVVKGVNFVDLIDAGGPVEAAIAPVRRRSILLGGSFFGNGAIHMTFGPIVMARRTAALLHPMDQRPLPENFPTRTTHPKCR